MDEIRSPRRPTPSEVYWIDKVQRRASGPFVIVAIAAMLICMALL